MPRMCERYLSLRLLAIFGSIFAEENGCCFPDGMEYFHNHRFRARLLSGCCKSSPSYFKFTL